MMRGHYRDTCATSIPLADIHNDTRKKYVDWIRQKQQNQHEQNVVKYWDTKQPVYDERKFCKCATSVIHFRHEINMLVCTKCGVTGVYHGIYDPINVEEDMYNSSTSTLESRVILYTRFLNQFSSHYCNLPENVMNEISLELLRNTSHAPIKASKVAEICRALGYTEYATHANIRISRMFNKQEPLIIPDHIIRRLQYRFNILQEMFIFTNFTSRRKIINFKYITRQFLLMEGEFSLASQFENLKTARFFEEDQRMKQLCERIARNHPNENWRVNSY